MCNGDVSTEDSHDSMKVTSAGDIQQDNVASSSSTCKITTPDKNESHNNINDISADNEDSVG